MRRKGFANTSLQSLMGEAKLTVGGFYNHFKDKQALLRRILRTDATRANRYLFEDLDHLRGRAFASALMDRYLSTEHRDNVDEACDVPLLSADVSRMDDETKQVYQDYVVSVANSIADRLEEDGASETQRAYEIMAKMVGAMVIARAVKDRDLSDEIMEACKQGTRERGA